LATEGKNWGGKDGEKAALKPKKLLPRRKKNKTSRGTKAGQGSRIERGAGVHGSAQEGVATKRTARR